MQFCNILVLLLAVANPSSEKETSVGGSDSVFLDETKKSLSILMVAGLYSGHLFPLVSLGEELVRRGHDVTLCANEIRGSNLYPGVPERVGVKFVRAAYDPITREEFEELHVSMQGDSISLSTLAKAGNLFNSTYLKVRAKVEEIGVSNFDIMVAEVSATPLAVYFHERGLKSVIFSTLMFVTPNILPSWPVPFFNSGMTENMSFIERLASLLFMEIVRPTYRDIFEKIPRTDAQFRAVLDGKDILAYPGLRLPLIFNTAFGFDYPRERYPLVSYVGPVFMRSLPPIKKELLEWLDSKKDKTVIYICMGTTGILTPENSEGLMRGVMKTQYHAIWVIREKNRRDTLDLEVYRERLFVARWVPQQAVLKHRSILLSILHCGLNGVQESLSNSLPVICIPLGYDQFEVASKVCYHEAGVAIYGLMDSLQGSRDIRADKVKEAVEFVVESDCAANTSRIRRQYELAGGREKAADLVEFYEEVGYDHLVPSYVKYKWGWVQYYNADVWLLILCVSVIVGWLSWKLARFLLRKCC